MKCLGKMAVGLAGGLALNVGICAPNPAATHNPRLTRAAAITNPSSGEPEVVMPENSSSGEPYAAIPVRNIFGLLPPAPPSEAQQVDPAKNLPKILPQGIMGNFGNYKVLFKIARAKPDPKAKDEYYILREGEAQEEIEVKQIDNAGSLVTFINHGVEQKLPLVNTPPSDGAAPADRPRGPTSMPMPSLPGMPAGGGNNRGVINFGGGGLGVHTAGGPGNGGPSNGGLSFSSSTEGRTYQPEPPTMSPDASTITIEVNRAALMNNPHPPYSPNLLPTTPLTELNTPDGK